MLFLNSRREWEYVTFPRWPIDGVDWLHPDDIDAARELIPGNRVLLRLRLPDAVSDAFQYGDLSFRAKPALQFGVRGDGLIVGDRVEVRSRMGRRRAIIGTICQMFWSEARKCVEYHIRHRELESEASYVADDFVRLIPPYLPHPEPFINIEPKSEEPYHLTE